MILQRVRVLHETPASAALLIIDHPAHGLEVRRFLLFHSSVFGRMSAADGADRRRDADAA